MKARLTTTAPGKPFRKSSVTQARCSDHNLLLTNDKHQTWDGWGGCFNELGWIALSSLPEKKRADVMRELFDQEDGCRFGLCRLPVGASDYAAEWYSHDETDGDLAMKRFSIARDRKFLMPYIKAALKINPRMKFFASPWSPPTWMKFPKAYNYGTMIWKPEILRAYALYLAKFAEEYRREGIDIVQMHPQNEPVADQKFPSCLWTGAQLRDFVRDHLGPTFRRRGLDCEIWLGTLNTDDYDGFVDTVLGDPAANRFIAGVGLQWAGKGMVQRVHASWPDKKIMQTENECGDGRNTWDYAKYVFGLMRHYISNGANAYVYWNMVLAPTGLSTWGWKQNSMVTVDPATKQVYYNPEFYVMKHFSRFISPGAVRLEVKGRLAANAVAFENPDGTRVAVVANPLQTERECVVEDCAGSFRFTMPPESFSTVEISS